MFLEGVLPYLAMCMTTNCEGVVIEAQSAEATRHCPLDFQNEISVDSHVLK